MRYAKNYCLGCCLSIMTFSLVAQDVIFEETNGYLGGQLFEFTTHNNTLYALSLDGVIRSEDAGKTWAINLPLPFDEAYYENTISSFLAANDSMVFLAHKEQINGEVRHSLQYSNDDGISWAQLELPDDLYIHKLEANNRFLFFNQGEYFLDIQSMPTTVQPLQTPELVGKRYFYQSNYTFVYNTDTIYFSSNNINWRYRLTPTSSFFCLSPTNLAVIEDDLYVLNQCNFFKTSLTASTPFVPIDTTYQGGRLVTHDRFLYLLKAEGLFEINTFIADTFLIQGSTFDLFDHLLFTGQYAFVETYDLDPISSDNISYYPLARFERFHDIQTEDIVLIRANFDRENTFKLVVIDNELFSCNVQGLHRYREDENEWYYVVTPLYQTTDIAWHEGSYYITDNYNIYRSDDLENWELLIPNGSYITHMLPFQDVILFFGTAQLASYSDLNGYQVVNERIDLGTGGDYPFHSTLFPPTICNDTLVMTTSGDLAYSADGGQSWDELDNGIQSYRGFPVENQVYYFKRHFGDELNIHFTKKSKYEMLSSGDYELIHTADYQPSSVTFPLLYYFLKEDELLFLALPAGGIVYSNDDGENWQLLDNSIPAFFTTAMAATDGYVYFASKQHGIRRLRKDQLTRAATVFPEQVFSVFPNPTNDFLNFEKAESGQLYDSSGRCLARFTEQKQIDVSKIPSGVYHIRSERGKAYTFVKQ